MTSNHITTRVREALRQPGLVAEFDRLQGTNIGLRGSHLDIQIDISSGRYEADMKNLLNLCMSVWL